MRAASFRGITFEVSNRTLSGGRRVVQHVYPQRDGAGVEDLGRKARDIKVSGFLFGPTYLDRRDLLIEALERDGPGTYIDPWQQHHTVSCQSWTVTETLSDGGYCAFDMSFVEAPLKSAHRVEVDSAHACGAAADSLDAAAADSFAATFSLSGINALLTDVVAVATAFADTVVGLVEGVAAYIGDLIAEVMEIATKISTLARLPLVLVARIKAIIKGVADLFSSAKARFRALFALSRFADLVPTSSAAGAIYRTTLASTMGAAVPWVPVASAAQVEAALIAATSGTVLSVSDRMAVNRIALIRLVSDLTLGELIRTSADTTYDSAQEALATRDSLSEMIEQRMQTADDTLFIALGRLQATMVQDLTQRAATLDQLVSYTPPATIPALVLAQRLYGDASKGADIVTRNAIRHPGMVPGGVALSVLAKGSDIL